jgi:hypothetical protein
MEPADRQAFAELRQSGLKTARAWALKETAMALYELWTDTRTVATGVLLTNEAVWRDISPGRK